MKPWYSKFGPLAWYRDEWVRFTLTLRDWLLFEVDYRRKSKRLTVMIGGRIYARSAYGSPSSFSSWFRYCNREDKW